jgi:hypothetical protein
MREVPTLEYHRRPFYSGWLQDDQNVVLKEGNSVLSRVKAMITMITNWVH